MRIPPHGVKIGINTENIRTPWELIRKEFRPEEMLMKNYWKLDDLSLFTVPYAYLDHSSYLADPLFSQKKIRLKFKGEFAREDSPYHMIVCRVHKRDVGKFDEAMEQLKDKMLLLGYRDYPDTCRRLEELIDKEMGKKDLDSEK